MSDKVKQRQTIVYCLSTTQAEYHRLAFQEDSLGFHWASRPSSIVKQSRQRQTIVKQLSDHVQLWTLTLYTINRFYASESSCFFDSFAYNNALVFMGVFFVALLSLSWIHIHFLFMEKV
jgi:hypothetical protein